MNALSTFNRRKLSGKRSEKVNRHLFNVETFEALVKDLDSGRLPLERVTVTDDVQSGLRCVIRKSGQISYHVSYDIDGSRPFLKIGDHPKMTLNNARHIAKTVRTLADKGIDVQEGLHARLIRELTDKGDKWRP